MAKMMSIPWGMWRTEASLGQFSMNFSYKSPRIHYSILSKHKLVYFEIGYYQDFYGNTDKHGPYDSPEHGTGGFNLDY